MWLVISQSGTTPGIPRSHLSLGQWDLQGYLALTLYTPFSNPRQSIFFLFVFIIITIRKHVLVFWIHLLSQTILLCQWFISIYYWQLLFICAMAYLSLWMTIGLFLILVHYKDFVKVCTQVCVWALACVFPDWIPRSRTAELVSMCICAIMLNMMQE